MLSRLLIYTYAFKKVSISTEIEIWLTQALLTDPFGAKRYGIHIIIREQFLGKISSRRIFGIERKCRVISPKMDEAMLFSTQRKLATSNSIWDPMPELTITSPYAHSRVESNTYTPWATLCQCRLFSPVRDFGFGLCLITTCILCFALVSDT